MRKRDSFRGTNMNSSFATIFKNSTFNKLYNNHSNELILGVRDGYINLYYNCDSIAKISTSSISLKGDISDYYTNNGEKSLSGDELLEMYDYIKSQSDKRDKLEKQAQERLFIDNNNNPKSEWYCIDVEYTKSFANSNRMENWRFDIIAISKKVPFRVALIELKYGKNAISGKSGIIKHIDDFYRFYKDKSFEILKSEIISIINGLNSLGVDIPSTLKSINIDNFVKEPEFYIITLNNNKTSSNGSTPMMTMNGYLFNDYRWNAKRISDSVKNGIDYYSITHNDKSFRPVFLFSEATLPSIGIDNILNEKYYVKKIVDD